MAIYTLTIKDFGEAFTAGTFTNITELDKAIKLVAEYNLKYEQDCDPELASLMPDYKTLVKTFKKRDEVNAISMPEITIYSNSNNTKTLKITCIRSTNLIVAF
jgi:RNA processing factor Prp31